MSDEDDWEKQLEDEEALEKNLNKDNKKTAFKDEDDVDSEEERRKKKEELKNAPVV
jgi:hypothetical protein